MTRDDRLSAAGEYVLGLMEGADRTAFEAAMRDDRELAAMVDRLARQMSALDEPVSGPAPGEMWRTIESRIASVAQDKPDAGVATAANESRIVRRSRNWMALAASVVIALGAGYFAGSSLQPPPQPTVVAVLLNPTDASPGAIIEAFADNSVRLVPLEAFAVPAGSVLQVWTLPDAKTGPVSLGTLDAAHDARLSGPKLPLPTAGQLYEITLEPSPGSPTGRPTGPILVKGFAKLPV